MALKHGSGIELLCEHHAEQFCQSGPGSPLSDDGSPLGLASFPSAMNWLLDSAGFPREVVSV